jgi:hypothetical protein
LKRSREVYKAKSKIADERSCVDVKRGVRERTEEDIADEDKQDSGQHGAEGNKAAANNIIQTGGRNKKRI